MKKFISSKFTLAIVLLYGVLLALCLLQAQTKLLSNIDWLDIATEGALLLLGLSWLALILQARPGGRVTQLLIFGLLGYSLGCYMDLLDEFFVNQSLPVWFAFIEKLPTPIGLLSLTTGLWLWREEQITINEQLRTREQFFRQHKLVDRVTKIYDARAMRHQIELNIQRQHRLSLVMIDLDNFSEINQCRGIEYGDRLLTDIAQLLACQLRSQDLVCRFAGDRFILMLPHCSADFAKAMATELVRAINGLECQASHAMIHHQPNLQTVSVDNLIAQVNQQMEQVKQARCWPKAV